jgi:hypothetical protein
MGEGGRGLWGCVGDGAGLTCCIFIWLTYEGSGHTEASLCSPLLSGATAWMMDRQLSVKARPPWSSIPPAHKLEGCPLGAGLGMAGVWSSWGPACHGGGGVDA